MIVPVSVRPRARIDLLDQFNYLAEAVGARLANRFLDAADRTGTLIAKQPRIGRVCDIGVRQLQGLRWFPIKHFQQYVIYYLIVGESIEIVRILHGRRNIKRIFREEER